MARFGRNPPDVIVVSSGFIDGIVAGKLVNTIQATQYDDLAVLGEDAIGNASLQVYANLGGSAQAVKLPTAQYVSCRRRRNGRHCPGSDR